MEKKEIKVKVCGMREVQNLRDLAALRPNCVGFICYPKSPRFVGDTLSRTTLEFLPPAIDRVGVFVNADIEFIAGYVESLKLSALQLHGDESVEQVRLIKSKFPDLRILKAIALDAPGALEQIRELDEIVDYFLFDTKTENYGGSGQKFDWTLLNEIKMQSRWFISGGIGPDDGGLVRELSNLYKNFFGVDINSRFESAPGVKDIELVKTFLGDL